MDYRPIHRLSALLSAVNSSPSPDHPRQWRDLSRPANIPLTATANDPNPNGVITQLSILAGTNVLGVATASPLAITWTNPPFGAYVLDAIATDNFGIVTTSAVVNITVTVQKPIVAITVPPTAPFCRGKQYQHQCHGQRYEHGGSIARVSFYAGTNLLAVVSNAPYGLVWTNPATATYSPHGCGDRQLRGVGALPRQYTDCESTLLHLHF